MIQRKEALLSVLGELQEATESSGLEALTRAAREVHQVLAQFQLPVTPCRDFPEWAGVDDAARGLYPMDAPLGLLPLNCKGTGNRLFDAVSLLLVGDTELSLELQVRTVVDMVLWKQYYLSGMIDSKMMLQAVRFSLCAEESEDMLNLPVTVLEAIFDADVKASCFPGSYANMWHLYALASVLQFNIYSIYPMFNLKIRPYFNRVIRPRTWPNDLERITIHVMWSGELQSESLFRQKHFVAVVQARENTIGSPDVEERELPIIPEELLNQESQLSYPSLKDKYNITKRTFYRWKRQTQERCKKSAARYEAKYFLQACYLEGKLIPLHQFKEFFPEISRSSYYNWKQELLKTGGNLSNSSTGEISPGESTEQESWSSPEAKQGEPDNHDSVASMFGLRLRKLELERAQNVTQMKEAKRCLQNCIAMNAALPFRVFKRNFPGISRSTYYNWRREAMLFNGGYKGSTGSSEESSDADKSQSPTSLSPITNQPILPRTKIWRRRHRSFTVAYMSKKQLRDVAKQHVQKSKWSLTKFKLKFPSMSPCFYWLWRSAENRRKKAFNQSALIRLPEGPERAVPEAKITERVMASQQVHPFVEMRNSLEKPPMPTCDAPHSKHTVQAQAPIEEQTFAMDVVALANFKAKAKLFLQQRFEQKSFPTFKEFRSYFPFTPRSTYYMWKRALYHGVSLVHG
ncbi:vertnin-like [Brachionichthys hirsutus]|uniref:vertnin-like n=1 Tax=Brachionichthys hirsutus TaxID=412623 RepID=UPI00360488AC